MDQPAQKHVGNGVLAAVDPVVFARRSSISVAGIPFFSFCARRWYWFSLLAFLLAMLSKASVVVLPILLLGIVWWHRKRLTKWDLARTAPFILIAIVLLWVNIWFRTHGEALMIRHAGWMERLVGAGGAVWFYLSKALLPIDLLFIYPQWQIQTNNPLWLLPLMAAIVVTAVLAWKCISPRASWGRPLLFAWGFFCLALAPVLGFTDVGFMKYSLVADHYQHIAILGLVSLVAAACSVWHDQTRGALRSAASATIASMVGALALLTWQQSQLYGEPVRIYEAALVSSPDSWLINTNLGVALANSGRLQESIQHLHQALRAEPDDPQSHYNLGATFSRADQLQEAIEQYRQALQLKPSYAEAHNNLAVALAKAGRLQEAIEQYQEALRLKPDSVLVRNNLGDLLTDIGRPQEAIEYYEQALQIRPDSSLTHYSLGIALAKAGQPKKAVEHYRQALQINPEFAEAHNNLGNALVKLGLLREAVEHFQQALRLEPKSAEVHCNLGNAYFNAGRLEEAVGHCQQAVRLKPDFTLAYVNLATIYAAMNRSQEAVASAQKALELARSQGQTAMAQKIEAWLTKQEIDQPSRSPTPP